MCTISKPNKRLHPLKKLNHVSDSYCLDFLTGSPIFYTRIGLHVRTFTVALTLVFTTVLLGNNPQSLLAQSSQTKKLVVEAPATAELTHPFVLKVITTDLPGEIQIEGRGVNNLGRIGIAISKSLINGVFSERRIEQYQLIATDLGNLTIKVSVGKFVETAVVKVVISGKNQRAPNPPHSSGNSGSDDDKRINLAKKPLTDLVQIRNRIKKTTLLVNEITELSTVIYTAVAIRNPSLAKRFNKSCYSLIPMNDFDRNSQEVTISGIKYHRTTIMKHLLYPVRAGGCDVEQITFQVAVTPKRGFGLLLNNKIISVSAPAISLTVKDYPTKDRVGRTQPQDFNYQYGDFAIDYIFDKRSITPNEPLPLTVSISGTGNFFTLSEPVFRDTPAGIKITKQGINDQYRVLDNDVRGKKFFRYYLTYTDSSHSAPTGNISLPKIELSYFSARNRRYVRESEKLPNLPLNIPGPGFNDINNSPSVLIDPNTSLPRWNEPIFEITTLNRLIAKHPETALLHQHTTLWTIVGWYHLAGLAGVGLFALLFLFGLRTPFPLSTSSNNSTIIKNYHHFKGTYQSFLTILKAVLLPIDSLASLKNPSSKPVTSGSRVIAIDTHTVEHNAWEHLQLALNTAKKKLLILEEVDYTSQKHSPKFARRCSVILVKLIRALPSSLFITSNDHEPNLPPNQDFVALSKLRAQVAREYWSNLALLLTLVIRSYLQLPKQLAVSKALQTNLQSLKDENKNNPQSVKKITWLQQAKTKFKLYEELIYKNLNTGSTSPSVTTKNLGEEGKDLLSLLHKMPVS